MVSTRPVPLSVALVVCASLVAAASTLALRSLALAADGSFYLVRILGEERVFGPDARFLANTVRQGPVLVAAHAGLTDTHELTLLFGIGQLLLPAIAWSTAVLLARADRQVFAGVAMTAALCSGTTWFFNVSESVLAVPLIVLVAVLLWQPRDWRTGHATLAAAASFVLVASYETAVVSGALLGGWAVWRSRVSLSRPDRYGAAFVAAASLGSIVVAVMGIQDPTQPPSGQSFLYYLVSLEPWPVFLGLGGICGLVGGWQLPPGLARWAVLAMGGLAVSLAALGLDSTSSEAYAARTGAMLAAVLLVLYLWVRWALRRRRAQSEPVVSDRESTVLLVVPLVAVVAFLAPSIAASAKWSRSLDAFKAEVARADDVVLAEKVLPADRRDVLFDWTSSSLSLIVRSSPTDGVLVDRRPSLVPFAPETARDQLSDDFSRG